MPAQLKNELKVGRFYTLPLGSYAQAQGPCIKVHSSTLLEIDAGGVLIKGTPIPTQLQPPLRTVR